VLTLFPPVWGVADKPDSNGSNGVLWAYYWTGHEFAAAIAAQEVREVRLKMWFGIAGFLLPAMFFVVLPAPIVALAMMAGLLAGSLNCRSHAFRRKLEIRGQSVECVVRRDYYACLIDTALDDASKQLSYYRQFVRRDPDKAQWEVDRIRGYLAAALPSAEKWVRTNKALVERAL
jgi:hypothetical protein